MKNIKLFNFSFLLFFIISCSPKPPPAPIYAPVAKIPSWINMNNKEDSLFIYGIGKKSIIDRSENSLNDIAMNSLHKLIEQKLDRRIKIVSDSTLINIKAYKSEMVNSRIQICNSLAISDESYKDDEFSYLMVKLNKNDYKNILIDGLKKATLESQRIINQLDTNVSSNNYRLILTAIDTIRGYLDYFPTINDSIIKKKNIGVLNIIREYLLRYNDRFFLSFESQYDSIPLINQNKRLQVRATDRISNNKLDNIWIKASSDEIVEHDLLLTKSNGESIYQFENIQNEDLRSFIMNFEIDYGSILNKDVTKMLSIKANKFQITVIPDSPKIYFDDIISNLDNKFPNSKLIDIIEKCFINRYSAIFVQNRVDSDLLLSLDISLLEHEERVSDIYPYFVHASGLLKIKDRKRNALVYNQKIGEREGSDFISIELAGLNALKNLSIDLSDKFCN